MKKTDSPNAVPDPLRLYLLGRFQLERAGQPIALYSHKVESLLAYLALHPEAQAREKLAALFWPEVFPQQASASLRVGLNNLRKQLGSNALLTDRSTVQLNPNWPLWVDARAFMAIEDWKASAGLAALQKLIGLYAGDLLPDFYETWLTSKREELRELYLGGLQLGAADARAHQDYGQTIAFAKQMILAEPTEEIAHRHLMICYAELGDWNAALQQFETCQRLLHEELGVAPSAETLALYERLVRQADTQSPTGQLSNLPRPDTSFIGRQQQRQDLQTLIGQARLVTLIGTGGSGKTRLAIQVASALLNAFKDGVWWVDLSALENGLLTPQTVARALGIKEQPQADMTKALCEALSESERLLVIDNCEHLLDGVGRLVECLLTECSQLRVMATSREALGVVGERVYAVPPLALPEASVSNPQALLDYEAIALFMDRARTQYPTLSPSPSEMNVIGQICLRLDGIPLALELAAAQMGTHSPDKILTRLSERLDIARPQSSTLARHQTLRAALDWGYDLLTAPEKVLFQRLAVFAGGWTLEQAAQVAGGLERGPNVSASDDESLTGLPISSQWLVQAMLTNLVNKSLVQLRQTDWGQRYILLETIRDYARERLALAQETETLHMRHYDYFAHLADEAEVGVQSAEAERWMTRLPLDHDNLRAALGWAVSRDRLTDGENGLSPRLAGALWPFWHYWGYVLEAQSWLSAALEACPLKPNATLLIRKYQARALAGLGTMAWMTGDFERAEQWHETALEFYRANDDKRGVVMTLNNTATAYIDHGRYIEAANFLEEGLVLARSLDLFRPLIMLLVSMGAVDQYLGRFDLAEQHYTEALAISQAHNLTLETCLAQNNLGDIAMWQGDLAKALNFYNESLVIAQQLKNKTVITANFVFGGLALCLTGRFAEAEASCREAMMVIRETHYRVQEVECLAVWGLVKAGQGTTQIAVPLLSAVATTRDAIPYTFLPVMQVPYEASLARLRDQMSQAEFENLWAAGRQLTIEKAVALVDPTSGVPIKGRP